MKGLTGSDQLYKEVQPLLYNKIQWWEMLGTRCIFVGDELEAGVMQFGHIIADNVYCLSRVNEDE